jgi:Tfp pilus assembly protein PilP
MILVKDFIRQLEQCDPNSNLQFYFLENFNLHNCKLETVLEADGQTEVTIEENENETT